jgi:hypothetical protein
MARLYARSGNTLFFGTGRTGIHSTVDEYAKAIQRQFEGVQSIEVAPDRSRIDIRVVGRVAFVSATGKNTVVDTSGRTASNDWRATVRLEQQSNNAWLITQDHISFNPAGVPAVDPSALSCCGHCLARIRVNVDMPTLALRMKADDPVLWYSEVDTIPPVGYTASVSLTPTRLSSGGRAVATLRHGTVKFREIVKQIRLDGTQWGAGAPAAR